MCSEDVIVKYKDDTESVACITFNGVWYDTDYYEVADTVVYWRYMTERETKLDKKLRNSKFQ